MTAPLAVHRPDHVLSMVCPFAFVTDVGTFQVIATRYELDDRAADIGAEVAA